MNRRTLSWATAGVAIASFGFGCTSSKPSTDSAPAAGKTGAVVAHIGNDVITSDEVKARMGEQAPYMRARLADPAARKEFLENLIKIEVFAQEAEHRGLDKAPEVQQQFRRLLVQQLVKQENEQKIDVADADLKAYFDKHVADYVRPERVRVQQIFLAADASGDAKVRSEAKAKAQKLLAQIRTEAARNARAKPPVAASAPMPLMAELARDNTADNATRSFGGDTRFLSEEELTTRYSPEFAKAVFGLSAASPLAGIIETPKGFHIARFLGRQPASSQSLDDPNFKRQITERYLAEARSKRLEDFYQELRKGANVSIDDQALAAVEVPASTGGHQGFGFPPGGFPRPMPPIANGAPQSSFHPTVIPAQALTTAPKKE